MDLLDVALDLGRVEDRVLLEVEDFVDFLRTREDDQRLTQAAARASEASFAAVWNNDEDAAYDRL